MSKMQRVDVQILMQAGSEREFIPEWALTITGVFILNGLLHFIEELFTYNQVRLLYILGMGLIINGSIRDLIGQVKLFKALFPNPHHPGVLFHMYLTTLLVHPVCYPSWLKGDVEQFVAICPAVEPSQVSHIVMHPVIGHNTQIFWYYTSIDDLVDVSILVLSCDQQQWLCQRHL